MMKIRQSVKRKIIQFIAFGMSNAHVSNFLTGKLYTGKWKNFCNPGLHCYSCPAATVSCPIGALQAVMGSMQFDFSFYIVGFLLAVGVLLGRFVCGFLCPFGLIQELLYKIPLKKLKLPKWMKYVKYAILVIFVLLWPVLIVNIVGMGDPAFCQFICPSGTLTGALPLLAADEALRSTAGFLFAWKAFLLICILLFSVMVYRFFCRVLCPLGAIYGLTNKISLYQLKVDAEKCIHCGKCKQVCLMDVDPVKAPQSAECIRCGACAAACPTGAIRIGFGIRKKQASAPAPSCSGNCHSCKGCARKTQQEP